MTTMIQDHCSADAEESSQDEGSTHPTDPVTVIQHHPTSNAEQSQDDDLTDGLLKEGSGNLESDWEHEERDEEMYESNKYKSGKLSQK